MERRITTQSQLKSEVCLISQSDHEKKGTLALLSPLLSNGYMSSLWYLGYDLDEPLPDHSSFTRIRTRYGVEVFRRYFDAIVDQCQQAELVWGKELYFDVTMVNANASMDSVKPRFAVDSYLRELFATEEKEEPEPAADAQPSLPTLAHRGVSSSCEAISPFLVLFGFPQLVSGSLAPSLVEKAGSRQQKGVVLFLL